MTKWEPKEKRVGDIVNAAVEIFLEKGYEGTSMEAIAARAKMSKGGLYHHFSSKDEILYYSNEKLSEPVFGFMKEASENPDPVEGIKFYLRNYIEHWTGHHKELAFVFLTLTKALASPELWKLYEDYYNMIEGFLSRLFERGIREGRFVEHNTKACSVTLLSALDGVLAYLIMNRGLKPEEVIRNFEEKFIIPILKT